MRRSFQADAGNFHFELEFGTLDALVNNSC